MKLIVNLKLKPLESQHAALLKTLEKANAACNRISEIAFQNKVSKQFNLHKISYHLIKDEFNLTAQMVVRCISKVADSYKVQKARQTTFKRYGSIAYDDRIIRFKPNDLVNLWTIDGRLSIPFVCGEYQRKLLPFLKGEVDLIYRKGQFFLNAVCDIEEPATIGFTDVLGVDLGIVNILTDSTNESFSGSDVENVRQRYHTQRQLLQHKASKQSQSGKRPRSIHKLLKRLGGREKNFRRHQNHSIAKTLVLKAKAQSCALALEDLKGIKERTKTRLKKSQRAKHSSWSFYQLREFITYKSKLNGIPVYFVDSKYTSQTCHKCGHREKANRVSQSEFVCKNCNLHINADFNASLNIRSRGLVNVLQSSENVDLSKVSVITGLKLSASS